MVKNLLEEGGIRNGRVCIKGEGITNGCGTRCASIQLNKFGLDNKSINMATTTCCFSFFTPSSSSSSSHPKFPHSVKPSLPLINITTLLRTLKNKTSVRVRPPFCALNNGLQYRNLGDSDLNISEITLGTMTFGEQNTEKEAHDILNYAFERGINALDTAEAYPIPMKKETQGRTDLYIGSWLESQPRDKIILATKVCGYSERSSYLRDNANVLRVDAANIKESVEKSLKRLGTDYIDLLQIHWPDRYVSLFGEFSYDFSKWRPSVPFVEQLQAFQELINEGKVRYIGVSNETSYGVMEFVHAAKVEGLPKIVSIQNSYSLLVRCKFEIDLLEVCHPKNCNIGLLAYSPLGGGSLTGKYIDINSEAAKGGRLNLFPGYMERYNRSIAREATIKYIELAKKHGLTPVKLALGFARDRPFMTSSIIGATSVEQLKEDIDAFITTERPLPAEVTAGIEEIYQRYKDPAIL
ncbi:hypothetical protein RJT34_24275 [Clitoria ternatea]|uniref:NADP-dependent oxidoreductase domain-containing protein n=1 Tax=Clitoria ternatea TaxID=43366 RepID=A0AAN9FPC5_CLITE